MWIIPVSKFSNTLLIAMKNQLQLIPHKFRSALAGFLALAKLFSKQLVPSCGQKKGCIIEQSSHQKSLQEVHELVQKQLKRFGCLLSSRVLTSVFPTHPLPLPLCKISCNSYRLKLYHQVEMVKVTCSETSDLVSSSLLRSQSSDMELLCYC